MTTLVRPGPAFLALVVCVSIAAATPQTADYDVVLGKGNATFVVPSGETEATVSVEDDLTPHVAFTACVSTEDPSVTPCASGSTGYLYEVQGVDDAFLDTVEPGWFVFVQVYRWSVSTAGHAEIATTGTITISYD